MGNLGDLGYVVGCGVIHAGCETCDDEETYCPKCMKTDRDKFKKLFGRAMAYVDITNVHDDDFDLLSQQTIIKPKRKRAVLDFASGSTNAHKQSVSFCVCIDNISDPFGISRIPPLISKSNFHIVLLITRSSSQSFSQIPQISPSRKHMIRLRQFVPQSMTCYVIFDELFF